VPFLISLSFVICISETYALPNKTSLINYITPIKVSNNLTFRTIILTKLERENTYLKMAKDILKEAIADAKAVREVALANAKAALEEAFTPKLQSMLSAKLSETLDETEELGEMNMYHEDDMEEDMDEVKEEEEETNEELEEIDLEEILSELELEEADEADEQVEAKDKDLDEAKDKDKDLDEAKDEDLDEAKDDKEDKDLEEYHSVNPQASDVSKVDYGARVSEGEEFDLDSLLEEINNLEEKEETDEVTEGDFGEGKDVNEFNFTAKPGQSTGEDDLTKTLKGLASGATDLADFLKKAADLPNAQKVFRLLSNPQVLGNWAKQIKLTQESDNIGEVQAELEETKKALNAIKGELNEVNLLNSKLLYVNRIFKANQLDEGQKLRVVETLDKADSAKEAKLIYETIKDTFNVAKSKKASINKKQTRTIKEGLGMASKAAGTSTAPKKEVIAESNNMVSRFQKLANIKIK